MPKAYATSGTLGRAGFVPERDAPAVERLRRAGAIVVGKTNVSELCLSIETDNLLFGRTANPYDPARAAGGSSGGEAAIVAACGSPLGLCSDGGGSARVPAHMCGVAAVRPTMVRVPRAGHWPPMLGLLGQVMTVAAIARSVADLRLALAVLCGPDDSDPAVAPVPLPDAREVDLGRVRVAFYVDDGVAPPSAEVARAVRDAAAALAERVAGVEEARPDAVERSYRLFMSLVGADGGAAVDALLQMSGTTRPCASVERLAERLRPLGVPTAEAMGLLVELDLFRAAMLGFLERYDLVVCPACASPAPPHGFSLAEGGLSPAISYSMAFTMAGWPAVVVPAGRTAEGLPVGVQLAARPWREDVALAAAEAVEEALGGWQPPPI